ncbi:uncharacterized protein LOC108671597 [Hyalella azteca]|uniref:Uncharacterized protein LOC108671597 n=1 Tax=Hyalella azteca TaxID=294128 RepID=A0A8B7NLV3_HYAAZ|nr:uncharacterized protein LOC108671597 [Hyalella azteca]
MDLNIIFAFFGCVVLQSRNILAASKGSLYLTYETPMNGSVLVNCAYCSDDQQPTMKVAQNLMERKDIQVNTFVSNSYDEEGKCFLVTSQLMVMDALLPKKTEFECILKDTLTGEVKNATLLYIPSCAGGVCVLRGMLIVGLLINFWL